MKYAHLNTTTNFTFLTGASHPHEYVYRAHELGYSALAITDECSFAGIVKAYRAAKECQLKLLIGSRFYLSNGIHLLAIAPDRQAYAELSGFITLVRRRAEKGQYHAQIEDLRFRLQRCLVIWLAEGDAQNTYAKTLVTAFKHRIWLGINLQLNGGELALLNQWQLLAKKWHVPMVACAHAFMHEKKRKPLLDVVTAIKANCSVTQCGTQVCANAEAYLKPLAELMNLYPKSLLQATQTIADLCNFSMDELRYQYPQELVPLHISPIAYLRQLVSEGKGKRYPKGAPHEVEALLEKELKLIEEVHYEYYFLTVHDIVKFARERDILCQGRGSAANSVVCYCLHITEISPGQINVLFERFISKERDEPPDIDVDFEHQRREEVIQYIYQKYGRERAAIAATVITYRARSAIRDVGKALGLAPSLIDYFSKSLAWWDSSNDLKKRIQAAGFEPQQKILMLFFKLVQQLLGFPRHLSQHVGGFVIAQDKVSNLVPLENASMQERTVIQWDKEDLETMNLLKVDILALGMLTALRKGLQYVSAYDPTISCLQDIPREDKATYDMLCAGDSIGVFQVESRAQMSMLPRLRPQCFYDLVIEIAIVRPGPIQGDMVHPYLRRRNDEEPVHYQSQELKAVLSSTLGVPLFQEQAIRLAMVAAGFSGGEADQLRRAMASWGKNGNLLKFEQKFIQGMLKNQYPLEYAQRLFEQIKGFGGYGFPESHSASFALLCYASSWLKRHHPAAFYCALLNSQPMGFYSPSQLVQDAKRHDITVLPVDINKSYYENKLERIDGSVKVHPWAIRLGFNRIKTLDAEIAKNIENWRGKIQFLSLYNLAERTSLTRTHLTILAEADALLSLSGNRYQAHWQAAAINAFSPLLHKGEYTSNESLSTRPPSITKNVVSDYSSVGLTLRQHPLALLRSAPPFNRCKTQQQLFELNHGLFVTVPGLVTGRQRPGTAKGTIFLTLEDETGNVNVVIWKTTQDQFRQALLTAKLLLVKGVVEISSHKGQCTKNFPPVVHVLAGELIDCSKFLTDTFEIKSRDFH